MKTRQNRSPAFMRVVRPLALVALSAATIAAVGSDTIAQSVQLRQPTTAFFNGTVSEYANGRLVVETDTGQTLRALINPRSKIAILKPADPSDLQEGTYIASTGTDKGNDLMEAKDLRIIEDKMRGVGEGFRPFHGGFNDAATMNAKIVSVSTDTQPLEINVRLRGRDMKVVMADGAPILFQTVGDATALKPGVPVSVFTVRSRVGTTDVIRINIGQDGYVPKF
jgi:hypothetical protein